VVGSAYVLRLKEINLLKEKPMTRVATIALVCCLAFTLTGCATIISGTQQTVTVQSYPSGAHVKFGNLTGTTPVTFTVDKGQQCAMEVSHAPGTRVVQLKRTFDPATLLNLIPPFWPGFIVDAWTGAMSKYNPEVVSVDFRASSRSTNATLTGFGG
jgi:hypothetical protein